jgi:hypothetical protein
METHACPEAINVAIRSTLQGILVYIFSYGKGYMVAVLSRRPFVFALYFGFHEYPH